MADVISSDSVFSSEERDVLRLIVAEMIPASEEHGVPGADDDAIFVSILEKAETMAEQLRPVIRSIESMSVELGGKSILEVDEASRTELAASWQTANAMAANLLVSLVVPCYYQDDRVVESLGYEARPPFPEGNDIEEGDWSLLDPVKAMGKIYREVGPE